MTQDFLTGKKVRIVPKDELSLGEIQGTCLGIDALGVVVEYHYESRTRLTSSGTKTTFIPLHHIKYIDVQQEPLGNEQVVP